MHPKIIDPKMDPPGSLIALEYAPYLPDQGRIMRSILKFHAAGRRDA
ncbi:MAG: hypothetical protein ACKOPH_05980 [Methylocystis sp.]